MSFKPQVRTINDDKWYDNALRFATYEEALANANDLMGRWLLVREARATISDDPVNYRWDPIVGLVRIDHSAEEVRDVLQA